MQAFLLLFWCTALFLPIDGTISPISTSLNPPLLDFLGNITVGGKIDSRFSLQSHYSTTRLPATAVLMNTLILLVEAPDLDYNHAFEYDRHATFDDYPSVIIGKSCSVIVLGLVKLSLKSWDVGPVSENPT